MNLQQLDYFERVYRTRSYRAAAREIPMSHQGLTKALASLEQELDVRLFVSGKGRQELHPTRYADILLDFAVATRHGREWLDREFDAIRRGSEQVRLACSTGVLAVIGESLPHAAAISGVALQTYEIPDLACDDELRQGRCNLAITVYPFDESFDTVPLYSADRWLWLSRNDPLASKDVITVNDLDGYHVGVVGKSFKNYRALVELAQQRGVSFAEVNEVNEIVWLLRYAINPGYVAFTARHIAQSFEGVLNERITARPVLNIPWGFGISRLRGHALTSGEEATIDCLIRLAHQKRSSGDEGFLPV